MKKRKLWLYLCTFIIAIGSFTYITKQILGNELLEEDEREEENESGADRQLAMWFHARAYPNPYYLNDKYQNAWQQAKAMREVQNTARGAAISTAQWQSIGPSQTIGGRILSIAIDPNNANNLFIGSASGGIWKSVNAGNSWSYVPTGLPVLGVASIVYHPSNSNILLAGTGEVYRSGNSNIGFNVWKARGTYGIGILRSTDGGVTWKQVYTKSTEDMFAIQMLKFDPVNANIVYACATDGLYKSTDAGVTWNLLYAKNYVSDVAINPASNSQIVIAVGNLVDSDKGIYRSGNGGTSFTKITSGLPSSFKGYIRLDYVNANKLYASIGGTTNELVVSEDFGVTWTAISGSGHCGGQYWFGHDLAVNPGDENDVIMGGVSYSRYTLVPRKNGAGTESITPIASGVHADVHDIKFVPGTTKVYIACDGGMYRSTDGGSSWANINNGLAATQFYASLATSPTTPNVIVGGLQDNGVVRYNGTGWTDVAGGDGGPCAFDPSGTKALFSNDARAVYLSTNSGSSGSRKLTNMGYGYSTAYDDRTAFMSPVAISKSNPSIMYVASDNLHISTDGGATFQRPNPADMTRPIEQTYKTAIALAISPSNANKVYVSTSPFSQKADDGLNINGQPNILKSINASDNTNYAFNSIKGTAANVLPDRFVMDFAIDPANDDHVYVVLGGFGTPHIYETNDGGINWTSLASGGVLPDVPFNAILIDPVNPQVLYVGTDFGVYASPDRGATWYDFNNGLSDATLVMDIQPTSDNKLAIATHGKGVYLGVRFSAPLPVKVVAFSGTCENNMSNLIWETTDEQDVWKYEVEKSNDGLTFSKAGTIAANNQSGTQRYQFKEILTGSALNKVYYRVKCVDIDGRHFYTKVITLQNLPASTFSVLPNPFIDKISVSINLGEQQLISLQLYDEKGRLVKKEIKAGSRGVNTITISSLNQMPPGTYFLEAIIGRERKTHKLIKR